MKLRARTHKLARARASSSRSLRCSARCVTLLLSSPLFYYLLSSTSSLLSCIPLEKSFPPHQVAPPPAQNACKCVAASVHWISIVKSQVSFNCSLMNNERVCNFTRAPRRAFTIFYTSSMCDFLLASPRLVLVCQLGSSQSEHIQRPSLPLCHYQLSSLFLCVSEGRIVGR